MPRILMLHTGGTLGMAGGRPSALRPAAFTRTLHQRVPELFELADIELELFANLDSCEMQPELWSDLARHLEARLPEFDGAVITHGTDTLAHSASALSFMLRNLPAPVVLTGAQRPLREIRSDARLNLIDAVTAALRGPREVTLCFDSHLFRGNRTRKVKVAEYDAFESANFPTLGILGVEAEFAASPPRRGPFRAYPDLNPRVFLLPIFPGLNPELPLALLPHLDGLVIEAYGAGNMPMRKDGPRSLRPLFHEARARGIPVVVVSQAFRNAVDLSLYESGAWALEEGAIPGGDMTATAALTKLMHVLAYQRGLPAITQAMTRSIAGELTTRKRR